MDGVVHRVHVGGERYGKGMTRANEVSWLESVYVPGTERVCRSDIQMMQHGDLRREGIGMCSGRRSLVLLRGFGG